MSFREILTASRRTLVAVAFALAGFAAAPAHAVPVSAGSTITIAYDRPFFILPDLTATISLTVESMTSNQIVLGVDVANTTSSWFLTSRLSSISFSTGVAPTGASDTSSAYNVSLTPTTVALNGSGGFWHNSSLRPTQAENFTLTLVGNFSGSTIDLSNFTAKFQSLIGTYTAQGTIVGTTAGSGVGTGTSGGAGGGSSVPEPSTLSLLAVGLFSVLTYRLVRQRAAQQPIRIKVRP
ncbi:MAG TPA: PEP-CTERM sorting domain-containing protein [Stellaceae bacterium]|jgi:hypothetical protein|nr:PEP-CTERM sorting domain-containing protein [Stellaceae bacterium]